MKWLSLLTVLISFSAAAQNIGIGTARPQSKLHIAGDLRIDSLAVSKAKGLVFHSESGVLKSIKFTGNRNDVLRGDGTFSAAEVAGTSWLTTGNAGTDPAVNFVGTTDAQPLRFRVLNTWMGTLTLSHDLVAFGFNTLQANTSGSNNIALGAWALEKNTGGSHNISIGVQSLNRNTTGIANIAIGSTALFANTTGEGNIALGGTSLALNNTGQNNIAIGSGSLGANTSGSRNLAIGTFALSSNKSGTELTAVGTEALNLNTSGARNTAFGYRALMLTTSGSDNTSAGFQALMNNKTGSRNTAFGYEALHWNTLGASNVAVGSKTLWSNRTGYSSVAIGDSALFSNVGGTNNTAVGELSMQNLTGGNFNVAYGSWTLNNASVVSNNTAVGHKALSTLSFGSNNTALGFGADVTAGNLTNATAIGYNAKVNASNKERIGNASVTKIEGQVAFTTPSDGRYKFNVREDVAGLRFIMLLRPVTYQFDVKRFDGVNDDVTFASYDKAQSIRRTGFIAQEVEKAADASGYVFDGVNKPDAADEYYTLSYESFVVPLVKAMQEQQQIINKQQAEIDELKAMVKELLKKSAE